MFCSSFGHRHRQLADLPMALRVQHQRPILVVADTSVEEMVVFLKESFSELLEENTWMDNVTKERAKEKVDGMMNLVAYPDWLLSAGEPNETALEEYYGRVVVRDGRHYENVRNFLTENVIQDLERMGKGVDRHRWITTPSVVNAFYAPTLNSIVFPAGFLQPPFYMLGDGLAALNYGAIGMVIGHEITHGFDDIGG
ncbi:unnamed protein product [Darwinula stevensoni]|uniref:Peptidase M13 N-terminal domain-containing protein n=1 Tax=Darwinula stevensoni TaxID=69355 RepID=A0A7R9AD50_9CRUS|nr:unnamed protein product [Darwinula stevensoni]CAG0900783.1 unnamed protein product [Darwinula stevensoni]